MVVHRASTPGIVTAPINFSTETKKKKISKIRFKKNSLGGTDI